MLIATAGRLFNRVRGRCEQGGIRAMYVSVCSFVQIDLLSANVDLLYPQWLSSLEPQNRTEQ